MKERGIVVVGFGWVGQANALALSEHGFPVSWYDPGQPELHYKNEYEETYKKLHRVDSLNELRDKKIDFIVCVGDRVDESGEQDISLIEQALTPLRQVSGATITLRSTIVPPKLSSLDFDFYLPEFLHEKHAVRECMTPRFFVLGRRVQDVGEPSFFSAWRSAAQDIFEGTPEEVSSVKYLSNLWNSVRVAFVNEFGDAISDLASDESVESSKKIIDFVLGGGAYVRYGKGFGGHCLPKDTRAFARCYADLGKNMDLLRGVYVSNEHHIAIQDTGGELSEWFSEWGMKDKSEKKSDVV